jgi:demethylmenaquinone methyltransferase/2-methoxy-6-polyprenyl-1,4-benzoquinol methylase
VSQPVENSERIVPHGTLTKYYGSDSERSRYLRDLFDQGSVHYDAINGILSFGTGIRYRQDALQRNGLTAGMRVLDVATGTGGVARAAAKIVGQRGRVVGLDPSIGMLIESRHRSPNPATQAFGEALPFRSASFDFLSMGYALRHLSDLLAGFTDYLRVLRPGGRVVILEITPPRRRLAYWMLRVYMNRIIPVLVRIGTRSGAARTMMEYYWDTTANCVPPETILEAMTRAGFVDVKRTVTLGVFSEYSGTKP